MIASSWRRSFLFAARRVRGWSLLALVLSPLSGCPRARKGGTSGCPLQPLRATTATPAAGPARPSDGLAERWRATVSRWESLRKRRSRVPSAAIQAAKRCRQTPASGSTAAKSAGRRYGRSKATAACSVRTRIRFALRSRRVSQTRNRGQPDVREAFILGEGAPLGENRRAARTSLMRPSRRPVRR